MKNTPALLLSLAIALTSCAAAFASAGAPAAFGSLDFSRAQSSLHITKGIPEHTRISLSSPAIQWQDTLVDFHAYRVYGLDGEPYEYADGRPSIPQVTRLYWVPNTGAVELVLSNAEYDLTENVDVLPYQELSRRFDGNLHKDAAVYDADGWYPREPAVMSAPMIYRDFRVVQVTLYPVQVNPRLKQVRVYRNLAAEIVATGEPGENELTNPRRPSGAFAALYRAHIANLDEHTLDDVTTRPGSYLILCKNQSAPLQWADTLATWKRRRGYSVTIDARQSWTTTQMKTAITQLYNSADPPLEFVCIIGDPLASGMAMPTHSSEYDHYFASLTSGDEIEDVGVGRLPASSAADLSKIMAKVMAYERTPHMSDPSWFSRVFLYASEGSSISSNEILMLWARQQFYSHTGITTVNVSTHTGNVNNTVVATRLNEGVSFFFWRGSVVGEMGTDCAYGTNNGPKLPVVLTITCGTGDFNTGESVSESWVLAGTAESLKGGVASIGTATYGTHVHFNNTVCGGLVYNICNLGVEHVSLAVAGAKAQLYAAFPSDLGGALNFTRWNNLMGEPSLSMWTRTPVTMSVTYPGTVNVGARRVRPQVVNLATGDPIQDALVVLWKGTECYAQAETDEFGFADVPVTVNTPGTMTLTVTKRNHVPFLADIACVPAAQMVTYTSFSLDDDNFGGTNGNGNGQLNPAETIDLPIYLKNFGTSLTATNISAVLTSNHPAITVVNATSTYPNLAPGDSALAVSPVRIAVSPTMQRGTRTVLTLTVTAGGEITHSSLPVMCYAGEAVFQGTQVVGGNGNGVLDPNETAGLRVTIRNAGDLALEAVTGTLVSNSPFISVLTGSASYGTIAVGQNVVNTGQEFQLRANQHTYPGHPAAMMLICTSANGYVDTVLFSLTVGARTAADPCGPDAYGYYAYENIDTAYDLSRPYSYVAINTIGTNLNLNDPGVQPPLAPKYSTARPLPFSFRFYGQDFDTITVCSNGWAALGNRAEQDPFRNYPIPGQQAPDALLAPFWDDLKTQGTGLGVWAHFDADSHRYIVQWRAHGAAQATLQDFEIILLDPAHYPTRDGNGIVIFQYAAVSEMYGPNNDIPYATVGIEAPGCLVGLQYRFNNQAAPGAGPLTAGRSIVFTTESHAAFGTVTGVVTDAATQLPMAGVVVSVDGQNECDTTDATGRYAISNVLAGTYTIRAHYFGFNDGTAVNTVVEMDSTAVVDFAMLHPEIALSVEEVNVSLPHDPATFYFDMTNAGNGPLDYRIEIRFDASHSLDSRWDYLTGYDVSAATGDQLIQGCEFIGDYWWISGGGSGTGQKTLYRVDLTGNYAGSIPQPSNAGLGWFDMAWDGEYLYGSSGPVIEGVDMDGVVQRTIPSPLNPTRALAYDPQSGHFWAADYSTDIYELAADGTVQNSFHGTGAITGLAWNPQDLDGYRLYIFGRDSTGQHVRVWRMHPVSGHTQYLVQLDQHAGDRSGGCTITPGWNSTLLVLGGIMQNTNADYLGVWELDFNTQWIQVTPMFGSVPAGTPREMEIAFDPAGLRDATYRVNLIIRNNSATPVVTLPVALTVALPAETPEIQPAEYRLEQNYPNPFNGRTTFRYGLRQPGLTTLKVFNLLGQEVATVVREVQSAGPHSAGFDFGSLPSGMYIYRIESGSYSDARKLILLR